MAIDLQKECTAYEKAICDAGGIDLFVGGLGADGHIAFNEPGSSLSSRTRIKTLTRDTKKAQLPASLVEIQKKSRHRLLP